MYDNMRYIYVFIFMKGASADVGHKTYSCL